MDIVDRLRSITVLHGAGKGAPQEAADEIEFLRNELVKTKHPITIFIDKGQISWPGVKPFKIARQEYKLLYIFADRQFEVLSREEISGRIFSKTWDYEDRSVDNLVAKLRKIIEPDRKFPSYIKTVRNEGYFFAGEIKIRHSGDMES